jgi:hypothetical protein
VCSQFGEVIYISTLVEVDWVHVKYAVDVHQPDTEIIRNVLFHRYGTTHKMWIVELEYTDIPGDCRPSLRSPWRDGQPMTHFISRKGAIHFAPTTPISGRVLRVSAEARPQWCCHHWPRRPFRYCLWRLWPRCFLDCRLHPAHR